MGGVESVAGHIFKALGKAIVNIFLTFVVCFVIAFAAVIGAEGVKHSNFNFTSYGTFVYIAAALIGVLAGYAGAVTALLVAAVREAFALARGAVGEARTAVGEVERGAGAAINAVEHRK